MKDGNPGAPGLTQHHSETEAAFRVSQNGLTLTPINGTTGEDLEKKRTKTVKNDRNGKKLWTSGAIPALNPPSGSLRTASHSLPSTVPPVRT